MGEDLWTAAEAARATGGRHYRDWVAKGVSIDSRTVKPGDLFVALKGPRFDGHNFLRDALNQGAAAVMIHRPTRELPDDAPVLRVADTMAGLESLAQAARRRSKARFVGITGSVGKTGSKEALKACLEVQAKTLASEGSLNNHWGVPLSLARMPQDADYGIFEMGMNHPGEIRALTHLVQPDVAVITNVEAAHVAYFESVTQIADAKAEIFEGLRPGGSAVLNRDNPFFPHLADCAMSLGVERLISFGRHPEADVRVVDFQLGPASTMARATIRGAVLDFSIGMAGAHWVINSLAVLAATLAVGADPVKAAGALARLTPLKGRGERHRIEMGFGEVEIIDDSYNANPTSMKAAFKVLQKAELGEGGRRIAILGDMLELGARAHVMHASLARAVTEAEIDLVFTCGPHMEALHHALPAHLRGGHASDSKTLVPLITASVGEGDVVLVKGSLGSRMALVVDALKGLGGNLPSAVNDH